MVTSRQQLRLGLLRTFAAIMAPLRRSQQPAHLATSRIVLIRPDHIGDLLFLTPALRVLRRALPDAYLTCMVGPWGKPLIETNPHLDEVITCEFPGFTRKPKPSPLAPYRALLQRATHLGNQHFDAAVVLRFDHWWGALLAYLAAIPCRLGSDIAECRPFLTDALAYQSQRHEVNQNLALIAQLVHRAGRRMPPDLLSLEFLPTAADHDYAARYLAERGLGPDRMVVAIHPGAGAAVKLWTAEKWAEVADALVAGPKAHVLITGSGDELDLAWSVYAHMRADAVVAAGDTTLGQLAALFARSHLVLGPDCGPLHLAVAVGAPTVHLYGPVDVVKFGPWGDRQHHVVVTSSRACIPCNRLDYSPAELAEHPCVREISVEAVLDAAERVLALTEQ
jgi:lipopolysaccharide heptosyltransferase II